MSYMKHILDLVFPIQADLVLLCSALLSFVDVGVFHKLKAGPFTSKKVMTHLIVVVWN